MTLFFLQPRVIPRVNQICKTYFPFPLPSFPPAIDHGPPLLLKLLSLEVPVPFSLGAVDSGLHTPTDARAQCPSPQGSARDDSSSPFLSTWSLLFQELANSIFHTVGVGIRKAGRWKPASIQTDLSLDSTFRVLLYPLETWPTPQSPDLCNPHSLLV